MSIKTVLITAAAMAAASAVNAEGVVDDNACTISLNPTTLDIPLYGDDPVGGSEGIVIFTADFATQGCSCVDPGDAGFDNPDDVTLVTPAGGEISPFRFNDIDGYAQFEYTLTAQDVTAGGGAFKVRVFDSCETAGQAGNRLVDEAEFDVDFDFVQVPEIPEPPTQQVVETCVDKVNGLLRVVGPSVACRTREYRLQLPLPFPTGP